MVTQKFSIFSAWRHSSNSNCPSLSFRYQAICNQYYSCRISYFGNRLSCPIAHWFTSKLKWKVKGRGTRGSRLNESVEMVQRTTRRLCTYARMLMCVPYCTLLHGLFRTAVASTAWGGRERFRFKDFNDLDLDRKAHQSTPLRVCAGFPTQKQNSTEVYWGNFSGFAPPDLTNIPKNKRSPTHWQRAPCKR